MNNRGFSPKIEGGNKKSSDEDVKKERARIESLMGPNKIGDRVIFFDADRRRGEQVTFQGWDDNDYLIVGLKNGQTKTITEDTSWIKYVDIDLSSDKQESKSTDIF